MNAYQKQYDKTIQKRFINIMIKRLEIKISELKKDNNVDTDVANIKYFIKKRNVFLKRLRNMTFKADKDASEIKCSRGNMRHRAIDIWHENNENYLMEANEPLFINQTDELTDTDSN